MGSITLKQITKSFGATEVIQPLDLEISDGEFVVFVGPSGCGKSTLLRLIAGLEDVTSGMIEINGVDATQTPPAKRGLAMVFQSYALYPHMSVRKNIAFPLKMAKLPLQDRDAKVEAAAAPSDGPLCVSPLPSCSMSPCPISMQRCASTCGWKFPNCTRPSRRQ